MCCGFTHHPLSRFRWQPAKQGDRHTPLLGGARVVASMAPRQGQACRCAASSKQLRRRPCWTPRLLHLFARSCSTAAAAWLYAAAASPQHMTKSEDRKTPPHTCWASGKSCRTAMVPMSASRQRSPHRLPKRSSMRHTSVATCEEGQGQAGSGGGGVCDGIAARLPPACMRACMPPSNPPPPPPPPPPSSACRKHRGARTTQAHPPRPAAHGLSQALKAVLVQAAGGAQQQRAGQRVAPRHRQHDSHAGEHAEAGDGIGQRQHGPEKRRGVWAR